MELKGKIKVTPRKLAITSNESQDGATALIDVVATLTEKQATSLLRGGEKLVQSAVASRSDESGGASMVKSIKPNGKRLKCPLHDFTLNDVKFYGVQPQVRGVSPVDESDRVEVSIRLPVDVPVHKNIQAMMASGALVELHFEKVQRELPGTEPVE